MILQALLQLYEDLARQGRIARPGWGSAKVSYALSVGDDGALLQVIPLKEERVQGKKTVLAPRIMDVPAPAKRTVGIVSNFLCDNAAYLLGLDSKGKPERTLMCFQACQALHLELLTETGSPAVQAAAAFFRTWDPSQATVHPALQDCMADLLAGANLVFWYKDAFVHEDPAARESWQTHYSACGGGSAGQCLVTGQHGAIAILHPSIKGVRDAQSSGASLVSFNAPSFSSYGNDQGLNAPVGAYAAFAYGAALNYLLADREHVQLIGDTTVVCWAAGGERAYQDFGMAALFGPSDGRVSDAELRAGLSALAQGQPTDFSGTSLDPDKHYYILGLAPNAARLSVRFFLRDTFGAMMDHLLEHYRRLEIVRPAYDRYEALSLWRLLNETVNQKSTDKSASPQLSGEVLRAILTGSSYPATLLNAVMLRIRAEQQVTRGRAAIIKAYFLRNEDSRCPKEVLTVGLNERSQNVPYILGRLFSTLEAVQLTANPGINATIRDKYFNSASSAPATIFPLLVNLAQKHLRKLDAGLRIFYDKQITTLLGLLSDGYPAHLALPEQGAFQLGYYHQTQKRYEKKEEN